MKCFFIEIWRNDQLACKAQIAANLVFLGGLADLLEKGYVLTKQVQEYRHKVTFNGKSMGSGKTIPSLWVEKKF